MRSSIPEKFPESSRKVTGKFPESSRKVPGKFPESSRKVPWKFPEKFFACYRKFPENLQMFPGSIIFSEKTYHTQGIFWSFFHDEPIPGTSREHFPEKTKYIFDFFSPTIFRELFPGTFLELFRDAWMRPYFGLFCLYFYIYRCQPFGTEITEILNFSIENTVIIK